MSPTKNRRFSASQQSGNQFEAMQKPKSASHGIADDTLHHLRSYVHEKPEQAALWCLGIGFVLGWKLKPW